MARKKYPLGVNPKKYLLFLGVLAMIGGYFYMKGVMIFAIWFGGVAVFCFILFLARYLMEWLSQ